MSKMTVYVWIGKSSNLKDLVINVIYQSSAFGGRQANSIILVVF